MEGGVEDGDLRHVPGGSRHADAGEDRRIVQRRQRGAGFDFLQHRVINQRRLGELLAAMHGAMTDGIDLGDTGLFQQAGNGRHRFGDIGNPFELGFEPLLAGQHVEDAELYRRTAGIDDQNTHRDPPLWHRLPMQHAFRCLGNTAVTIKPDQARRQKQAGNKKPTGGGGPVGF